MILPALFTTFLVWITCWLNRAVRCNWALPLKCMHACMRIALKCRAFCAQQAIRDLVLQAVATHNLQFPWFTSYHKISIAS